MPELPEVETVRSTLKRLVINHRIENVEILYSSIVEDDDQMFKRCVEHQTIKDILRYGKYLIFVLENQCFISHLRMEGKYLYEDENAPISKHTHVIFHLDKNKKLSYHDVRKFGRLKLVDYKNYMLEQPLCKLGKEPFDIATLDFYKQLRKITKPIKVTLLDQSIICGIGNIYANEILFASFISPYTRACDLSKMEVKRLIENSVIILNEAIRQGGTTIRSFSSNGIHGLFSQELLCHDKEGKECPRCHAKIKRDVIVGRSAYYCPHCQIKKRKRVIK